MRGIRKYVIFLVSLILMLNLLSGCQAGAGDGSGTEGESDAGKNQAAVLLEEQNEIPEDGVITQKQLKSIAGTDAVYCFNGKTENGIAYQWIYKGEQIQNPVEQNLKVACDSENLEEVKALANQAPYALKVTLQQMQMAAPAKLVLTLQEEWKADRVLYCVYENGKLYQLSEASIETVDGVSQISFQVTRAGGDYYLLGGLVNGQPEESSLADEEESKEESGEGSASDVKESQAQDSSQSDQKNPTSKTDGKKETKGETKKDDSAKQTATAEAEKPKMLTCTLTIDCKTILDNWDDLKRSKQDYVPANGMILESCTVEFTEGETVFDVLKRELGERGIHMESEWTPMYNSYYVSGIHQLYEFDCGQNSGWMYSVNGWYPNYGCSSYTLEDGDVIEWRYTCDLGSDVGNVYMGDE